MNLEISNKTLLATILFGCSVSFATTFVSIVDAQSSGGIAIIEETAEIGTIVLWGDNNPPEGWLILNGQSTAMYPELSTIFGSNLPDMRGQFARNSGGNAAALGVIQNSDIKSHTHSASFSGNALPPHSHTYSAYNGSTKDGGSGGHGADNKRETKASSSVSGGTPTGTVTLTATGSGETRPNNVALLYIVKIK